MEQSDFDFQQIERARDLPPDQDDETLDPDNDHEDETEDTWPVT